MRLPFEERFWSKVKKEPAGCWLWLGSITNTGYGAISRGKNVTLLAHRAAYEMTRGKIPEGLQIDHLCRVRNCVNPEHLETVTLKINVLRGIGVTAINATKTHCDYGHQLDGYSRTVNQRFCKTCRSIAKKAKTAAFIGPQQRAGQYQKAKTHCPQGHLLEGDNLIQSKLKQGRRACRTCDVAQQRARKADKRG